MPVQDEVQPDEVHIWSTNGKISGVMVSKRGIKANLEKLQVIIEMKLPTNLNEV